MPTYSYRCPKCGHEYERLQRITDNTRARCPRCRTRGERRITGGGGLVFKGSGFYITDYKRAGRKTQKERDGAADVESGAGKEGAAGSDTSAKSPGAES